jgi:thiol:disulfide interchange protein DsbG
MTTTSKRFVIASTLATTLIVSTASAFAAGENYPKAIKEAVDAGAAKVVRSFPAASGLTGWVLSQGGRYTIVYSTPDKKTLLLGSLISENGENLSSQYEEKYAPTPDLKALWGQLDKSAYVTEGASTPKNAIYVFVDANCPFCHLAWKALQPYEKAGLQVRWILVATLGPTSMPKAIEVLSASDKTAAFRKMEENQGKAWKANDKLSESAQPALTAAIRKNTELMSSFGISGTPGIVWKDKQGKVQVKPGMPRLSEFPEITQLPPQKIEDPELQRFQ